MPPETQQVAYPGQLGPVGAGWDPSEQEHELLPTAPQLQAPHAHDEVVCVGNPWSAQQMPLAKIDAVHAPAWPLPVVEERHEQDVL